MTYPDHLTRARTLNAKAALEELRQLGNDRRFAAVVYLLEQHRESWAKAVADQKLAASHGNLAHAAGSLLALQRIESDLTSRLQGKGKAGAGLEHGDGEPGVDD